MQKKKQTLELISEFSQVIEDKINIQKSIVCLQYTSYEHMDTEIKNTILFTIAKKNEILRCKFSKTFARFVCWDYTMLMKEIKDLNKWGTHRCQFFPN